MPSLYDTIIITYPLTMLSKYLSHLYTKKLKIWFTDSYKITFCHGKTKKPPEGGSKKNLAGG